MNEEKRDGDVNSSDWLDCPFCGARPVVEHIGNDFSKKRCIKVKCSGCHVERTDSALRFGITWLEEVSQNAWNKRASNDGSERSSNGR